MRATVDDVHHRLAKYLQKHRQHNDTKAILIHFAALATAKETPKIAFAPKFDLFGYHLNQSSSDQFDFAQKQKHHKFLSDNRIYILHRKTPFPRYAFPPSRSSTASCSPVDAPEALPKTPLSVITSTSMVGFLLNQNLSCVNFDNNTHILDFKIFTNTNIF
jgi:hypothetical protein